MGAASMRAAHLRAAGRREPRRHERREDDGPSTRRGTTASHGKRSSSLWRRSRTRTSAGYVPPEARVAVFDNDGTLWCERPIAQGGFIVKRLVEVAEEDPSLRQIQPWKMAYERNSAWVDAAVVKHYDGDNADLEALLEGVAQSFFRHEC